MNFCVMSGCRREPLPGSQYCYMHAAHQPTPPPTDSNTYDVVDAAIDASLHETVTDADIPDTSSDTGSNDFSFDGGDSGGGGAGGDF